MEVAFNEGNREEVLHILTKRGAGLDLECEDALHRACEKGWLDVARLLLNKFHIDPDEADFGTRPIHLAAKSGQVEAISFLIVNGARVDSEDANGSSALHYAMKAGQWETAEALVRRFNANLLKCNVHGIVPLLLGLERALRQESSAVHFHSLLKLYDEFLLPCNIPYYIVQLLLQKEWTEELIYLFQVDKDKSKRSESSNKHTSLILTVAANGDVDLLKFLLKHDADITTTDEYGNTALLLSISQGHIICAKSIVDIAPSLVTIANSKSEGSIRFAVRVQSLEMVKFLVESGADPDREDNDGNTPLLSALRQDSRDIAEYLVKEAGCNLGHLNKNGGSPFSMELTSSFYEGNTERALWLLNLSPECDNRPSPALPKDALYLACQKGLTDVIDTLLQVYHCDPLQPSSASGLTPFHVAIKDQNIDVLKHLLAYKSCPSRVQARSGRGQTIATLIRNTPKISKLFEMGENENVGFARKPVKVFLLGDASAGKSSLAHAIKVSTNTIKRGSLKKRKPTLGIKLRRLQLKETGPILLYDCPGKPPYTHSGLLKHLAKGTPALYILVTDINRKKEEVTKNVAAWASYINSLCSKNSYIVVVGSHTDKASMNQWGFQNCTWISESCRNLIAGGGAMLDCRRTASQSFLDFLSIVTQSCASIRATPTRLQFDHLALYAFLREKLPQNLSVSLSELLQMIGTDPDYIPPTSNEDIQESLSLLSDKGLVFYWQEADESQASQIVLQPQWLLSNVLKGLSGVGRRGQLFSSNGMIEEQALVQSFPKYNPQIVSLFLQKLSQCIKIPRQTETPDMLFFPSLVTADCLDPDIAGSWLTANDCYKFGWFIKLNQDEQQLQYPIDILHQLQMELMSQFPSNDQADVTHQLNVGEKSCRVWQNGVYISDSNTQAVIELLDEGKCLRLLMTCPAGNEMKLVRQRSELLKLIQQVKSNYCCSDWSQYESEHVLSPSQLIVYPLQQSYSDLATFDVKNIAKALLDREDSVTPDGSNDGAVSIKELLYFEAYHSFPVPHLMKATFDDESPRFLESFISMSSNRDDPTVIGNHLLKLSPETVAEVTADVALTPELTMLNLFKRWAQNVSTPIMEAIEDNLDQYSIFSSKSSLTKPI